MSQQMISPTATDSDQFDSFIGDLTHRIDVSVYSGRFDLAYLNKFISNEAQANWLKRHRQDLIPPPQNGVDPSIHHLGQIFERNYLRSIVFRSIYISTCDFS